MPIDTSSYYPEVDGPEGDKDKESLNSRHDSLFGTSQQPLSASSSPEEGAMPKNNLQDYILSKQGATYSEDGSVTLYSKEDKCEKTLEKIADQFSHIISWLLVPLIMPVVGILYIFRLSILDVVPAGMQTAVTFVIAGINFFAPMLLIFLLKILGVVNDVGLNQQKERAIPYIITALCYGGSAWFVASRGAPVWVAMFFCGGVVASLINMAITFKWKISAHAAAIAGVVALLIRLQRDVAAEPKLFLWLILTVGAAGLLGSARIWLGRHTVWQVLAGYAVGFCSVFFMMYIH